MGDIYLLPADKFKPQMHLKQLLIELVDHLLKIYKKSKETGYTKYTYRNELDKACFQHYMVYGDFKDLARKTASHKVLINKAFNIGKSSKRDGYQRGLASMVYKFSL